MKLLLLRHALAADRAAFAATGKDDRLRPLTDDGRKKMRKIGEALAGLLPEISLIATSPYLRALESAEILARACPDRPVLSELAELAPAGAAAPLLKFLQTQKSLPLVAFVGHEPLRKGGACLLEFTGRLAPANATLLWHLTAAQLRSLR